MKNRIVSIIKWTAIVIGWCITLYWVSEQPESRIVVTAAMLDGDARAALLPPTRAMG